MSIYKKRNKYWVDIRHNRTRYRRPSPENSYSGAKAYEAMLRQKLARGDDIIEEKEIKKEIPSFKEFSKNWLNVYVKNNNSFAEWQHKESSLRLYLVPYFSKYQLNKIDSLLIENFKIKISQTKLSPTSINHILSILSVCLKTAVEWGIIENSPKIKKLKTPPKKIDYLTEEEANILLENTDGQIKEMIYFALKTGVRFGELIALDWQDINFQEKRITIRRYIVRERMGSTKNNKIRYIPLIQSVSDMLIKRYQTSGFFSRHETRFTQHYSYKNLYQAYRKSGLRKIGWYKLRHTFASHLAQNSISIQVIKELLGHSDITTIMKYTHLSPSVLIGAINTLEPQENITKNFGHNLATISHLDDKNDTDLAPAISNIPANNKQKQTSWSVSVL